MTLKAVCSQEEKDATVATGNEGELGDGRLRLLMIGPLPPPLGGTTILFEQLVKDLSHVGCCDIEVVRTNFPEATRCAGFRRLLRIVTEMFSCIRTADVVTLHASISGTRFLAPIVMAFCFLYQKPWIFRGFGGNFVNWYQASSVLIRRLFRCSALGATRILLETRASVAYFSNFKKAGRVEWYPNSRPWLSGGSQTNCVGQLKNKLLYLGHVQESKGILVIRDAVKLLGKEIAVDIYGPLCHGMTTDQFEVEGIRYCGVVDSSKVVELIKQYAALVFPTMYDGEGYPGVVLEAFSAGVPVITTRFRAIPEIVDDTCGLLVEPGDPLALATAMERLLGDPGMRQKLADGARRMGAAFDSKSWSMHFLTMCNDIVGSSRSSRVGKS